MARFVSLRAAGVFACVAVPTLLGAAFAQDSPLYSNREYRFSAIFPSEPKMRDVPFTTHRGDTVTAKQFYVERPNEQYLVTVVHVPNGPGTDDALVEHAAEQLRKRGDILFQFKFNYDPGVPGRQLNIRESNGRQLRSSMYMWDNRLIIAESSAPMGTPEALQLEQSITLLDDTGGELDRGKGN
jgi:hypothetical protein